MNKKLNTVLFLIGATLSNIIIILILWLIPLYLYMTFIAQFANEKLTGLIVVVLFIAAILGTYLLYNAIMAKILKKVDMEKYFELNFKKKKS